MYQGCPNKIPTNVAAKWHKWLTLQFCRSEAQHRFHWAKIKVSAGCVSLSVGSKGESIALLISGCWQNSVPWSLFFYSPQLRTTHRFCWLVVLRLLQSQQWSVPFHPSVLISPLPSISCSGCLPFASLFWIWVLGTRLVHLDNPENLSILGSLTLIISASPFAMKGNLFTGSERLSFYLPH